MFNKKFVRQVLCMILLISMFNVVSVFSMYSARIPESGGRGESNPYRDDSPINTTKFVKREFDSMDDAAVSFGIEVFSNPNKYTIDEYEYGCGIYKKENGKYCYNEPYTQHKRNEVNHGSILLKGSKEHPAAVAHTHVTGCRGYKNFSSPGDCDFVVKNFMVLYLTYKEKQQGGKIKLITKKCTPCEDVIAVERIKADGFEEMPLKNSPFYNYYAVDITDVNEEFLELFYEKSDIDEKE